MSTQFHQRTILELSKRIQQAYAAAENQVRSTWHSSWPLDDCPKAAQNDTQQLSRSPANLPSSQPTHTLPWCPVPLEGSTSALLGEPQLWSPAAVPSFSALSNGHSTWRLHSQRSDSAPRSDTQRLSRAAESGANPPSTQPTHPRYPISLKRSRSALLEERQPPAPSAILSSATALSTHPNDNEEEEPSDGDQAFTTTWPNANHTSAQPRDDQKAVELLSHVSYPYVTRPVEPSSIVTVEICDAATVSSELSQLLTCPIDDTHFLRILLARAALCLALHQQESMAAEATTPSGANASSFTQQGCEVPDSNDKN